MTVLVGPSPTVRRAGRTTLWAGVLGAGSGLLLAFMPTTIEPTQWSYPLSPAGHAVAQTWFAIQHIPLVLGIWGLASWIGEHSQIGYRLAAGGLVALTALELIAIIPADQPLDATFPVVLGGLYGIVSISIGVGTIMLGRDTLRSNRIEGPFRFVPLVAGIWVFVPMLPALALSFLAARLTITIWMLLFAALGWMLSRDGEQAERKLSAAAAR